MKTEKKLAIFVIMACLMVSAVEAASASTNIQNVTLNEANSVNAAAGETITVAVTVELTSKGHWNSTKYQIVSEDWSECLDTADHINGTYTESFPITAPLIKGNYTFKVRVYHDNSCDSSSDTLTLTKPKKGIHVISKCGDSVIEAAEFCDSNSQSCTISEGYLGSESCNSECSAWDTCITSEFCGDGIQNGNEQCEDGNNLDGDGCSAVCQIEFCGDAAINNVNEICDGNSQACTVNGYAGMQDCSAECEGWNSCIPAQSCGDGIINEIEACDDGNINSGDGCSAACQIENRYYYDNDKDGYGNASNSIQAVNDPEGYVSNSNDCNDNTAAINPDATEVCNGLDDDCDGSVDEENSIIPQGEMQSFRVVDYLTHSCYNGTEGTEGVGVCTSGTQTCSIGAWDSCVNEVLPSEEICDGLDNDCDGAVDNGNFTDKDTDGIKDCVDTDNDNDGVDDSDDFIEGDSSDVNTNVPGLLFLVDDVPNAGSKAGTGVVKFEGSDGSIILEFEYDFSAILDLSSINITISNESGESSMIINGINLSGQNATKTAYLNRISGSSTICIIDAEVDSIAVTDDCSNGNKLVCDGSDYNGYTCTAIGNKYKITGLKHSAAKEYSYTAPAPATEEISLGSYSGVPEKATNKGMQPPKPAPAETPAEKPAEEEAETAESAEQEEETAAPAETTAKQGFLKGITGRVVNSIKSSPKSWAGISGISVILLIGAYLADYFSNRRKRKY